jgi:hypothetical protein
VGIVVDECDDGNLLVVSLLDEIASPLVSSSCSFFHKRNLIQISEIDLKK